MPFITMTAIQQGRAFYLIIILLSAGIFLRFIPLNTILYADDIVVMNVAEQKYFFAPANINPHPPLNNLFLIISTTLLGISERTFRLPAFIFSIATLILIYHFTKKFINEKAALWSLFLASLSVWHIYSAETNIGGDGILAFFLLLVSYFFLKDITEKKSSRHVFVGVLIALASFVKETTILLIPVFLLYFFFSKMKVREAMKKTSYMVLGFSLLGFIFFMMDLSFNHLSAIHNLIQLMLRTGVEKSGYVQPELFQYFFSFFKIAVWATPFFLLITLLWFFKREKQSGLAPTQKNVRLYIQIFLLVYTSFFIGYISPSFDKPRYLLTIVPFLCILAGDFLSRFTFTKKEQLSLVMLTLLFFLFFFFMNTHRNRISFDQKEKIVENIKTLQLNFDIGLISETGNPGFVVNLRVVLIAYVLAFIFVAGYLLNSQYQTSFFILFFAAAFAFNLFLAQEFVFHGTAPNYAAISKELHQYAMDNNLQEPIYLFKDPSMAYYLRTKYHKFYDFDVIQNSHEHIEKFKGLVHEKGGSVLLIDLPFINKEGELWQFINTCKERKTFSDKDMVVGYIFDCSDQKMMQSSR